MTSPAQRPHDWLRHPLLLAVLAWLVATVPIGWAIRAETYRAFEDALERLAMTTLAFAEHELTEIRQEAKHGGRVVEDADERAPPAAYVFQVYGSDGQLAYRSRGAPEEPLASVAGGLSESEVVGVPHRVYTVWNAARTFQIRMAAPLTLPQRDATVRTTIVSLALLALLLASTIVLPVRRESSTRAAPDAAAASRADASPPTQPAAVVQALNSGLARLAPTHADDVLVHSAAHSLRTPLASLRVLAGNLRLARDEPARLETLEMIETVVHKSTRLVDGILALARAERSGTPLDRSADVDLLTVCERLVEEYRPGLQSTGIALQVTPDSLPVIVRADRELLEIAVRTVVDNAVSFSDAPGAVWLQVGADDDAWAGIRVHDAGPGVRRAADPGVARSGPRNTPHAGLGLPLVSRIVELHGGSAHVGVSSLLGGAVAVIRLPRATEAPALAAPHPVGDAPTVVAHKPA